MERNESSMPFLVGGIMLAIVLILLSFQRSPNLKVLNRQFAPQPTVAGAPTPAPFELPQVSLGALPTDMQTRLADLSTQLAGGKPIPALTPQAGGPSIQVTVSEVRRSGERVTIRGKVRNIGKTPITIRPDAFSFRDSTGVSYATDGSGTANIASNEETSFDLTVPLPSGRGLTLIADIPPDPPIQMDLLLELRN